MDLQRIMPALADVSQDIAGPIPVEIIQKWVESPKTQAVHDEILAPFVRTGVMVCSDAAGLSKLSARRSLIEVMKIVSQPKEIIHAHGKAIGGQAIGLWAADNTQMFYADAIDPNLVVAQMVAAQRAMRSFPLQVGIGLHKGTAYEIGGGLYGADADVIEAFTEDESKAKEIIVSDAVKADLRAPFDQVLERRGQMNVLAHDHLTNVGQAGNDVYYPAPFDQGFFDTLLRLDVQDSVALQALHRERVRVKSVVLVRIFHVDTPRLLDGFAYRVATNTVVHTVTRDFTCNIIKSNGALAIITCDSDQEAVDLTLALSLTLKNRGFVANCAVSKGEVLVFSMGGGLEDLAGSPVNIASKLAEDTHERNVVFIEGDELVAAARQHGLTQTFEVSRSGVSLRGVRTE